jgi:beta-phosphoglucomutase-like phosphatase (HAD superfamily)
MMIRAIAWDVDGTLVDSEPLHHAALLDTSIRFGADLRDLHQDEFRGVHMRDVWIAVRDRFPSYVDERG